MFYDIINYYDTFFAGQAVQINENNVKIHVLMFTNPRAAITREPVISAFRLLETNSNCDFHHDFVGLSNLRLRIVNQKRDILKSMK